MAICSELQTSSNPEDKLKEWRDFNLVTVKQLIIPAYQDLSHKASQLHAETIQLCREPDNTDLNLVKARLAFHETMDAWQFIQNVQFGPIQTLMRNYSMQFWPDKKNHVEKQLRQLINSENNNALSETEFHKASVSIKGLPAIEHLLFNEKESPNLFKKPFHCQVLQRIAAYTAKTSQDLVKEWQEMQTQFEDATQLDGYFEDDIDASTSLLKTLVEPIEVIRDLKILRPLGSEIGQQKIKRLESWLSERSLRNIQFNIKSLSKIYHGDNKDIKFKGLMPLLDKQAAQRISTLFAQIKTDLNDIPAPIERSLDTPKTYQALQTLSNSLKLLHAQLESAIAEQGIHLGFNSRDGD